ncbi:dihydrofolate reductase [marine actinobacterium PHSC20C1]|nr:dihydrofolate reductase [marine actinobacterium PHSC20C1]
MTVALGLIWAQSEGGVIGQGGTMPWQLPEDLAHFKKLTLGSPVIMGRKTWKSLPPRFRPLPGRRNIVVTRQADWNADGAEIAHSVDAARELAATSVDDGEIVWVIGGAEIYRATIASAHRLEITQIRENFVGDTIAPELGEQWMLAASDPAEGWHTSTAGLQYRFERYENHASNQR